MFWRFHAVVISATRIKPQLMALSSVSVTSLVRLSAAVCWIKLIRTCNKCFCSGGGHYAQPEAAQVPRWCFGLVCSTHRHGATELMDTLLKSRDEKVSVGRPPEDGVCVCVSATSGGRDWWVVWVCGYANASWQETWWQASGISAGFPSLSLLSAGPGDLVMLKRDAAPTWGAADCVSYDQGPWTKCRQFGLYWSSFFFCPWKEMKSARIESHESVGWKERHMQDQEQIFEVRRLM